MSKPRRWYGLTQRERERAALEDAASEILRTDRRQSRAASRRSSSQVKRSAPDPLPATGWVSGLENSKRAMARKQQS